MSAGPFFVALFCEGDFDAITSYPTKPEAVAYAQGLSDGAYRYGAGSCVGYVLPGDEEEMRAERSAQAVGAAMTAMQEKIDGAEREP